MYLDIALIDLGWGTGSLSIDTRVLGLALMDPSMGTRNSGSTLMDLGTGFLGSA